MNIYEITYRRPMDTRNQFKRVHALTEDAARERVQGMFPDADVMRVTLRGRTKAGTRRSATRGTSIERAIRAGEAAANW